MRTGGARAHRASAFPIVAFLVATIAVSAHVHAQCEVQRLEPIIVDDLSGFGVTDSMALSDRYVFVGDHASNPPLFDLPGEVLVYRRGGSTWALVQVLRAPDDRGTCPSRAFGRAIAVDDDVLVVGEGHAVATGCQGAAYVYRLVDGTWTLEQELAPATFNFASNVAIDGDTIALGMSSPGGLVVSLFRHGESGWTFDGVILPPPPVVNDQFGRSVSVSGDTVLIGSLFDGVFVDGAAYIYRRVGGSWQFESLMQPAQSTVPQSFGEHVSLHGDVAAVADPYAGTGVSEPGAVHVYRHDGAGQWNLEAVLGGAQFGAVQLGLSVAIDPLDPNRMLVGCQGRSLLFQYVEGQWQLAETILPPADVTPAWTFGRGVALRGDLATINSVSNTGDPRRVHIVAGLGDIDCNGNGSPDACDIDSGSSADTNGDGLPDECGVVGDLDGDLSVGPADLGVLLGEWGACAPRDASCVAADLDGDGGVDEKDLAALLAMWSTSTSLACGDGDCCIAHADPGCRDAACCAAVCADDSFCCDTTWDSLCVDMAQSLCGCVTPRPCDAASGDCCVAHAAPGCADVDCCEQICAVDVHCCIVEWDAMCQAMAQSECGCPEAPPSACGLGTGDCCTSHAAPGCDDVACCAAVCADWPFCCVLIWDSFCVSIADNECGGCP